MNVVLAAMCGGLSWVFGLATSVSVPVCAILAVCKIVGVGGARQLSWWVLIGEPLGCGIAALTLVICAYLAASTIRS